MNGKRTLVTGVTGLVGNNVVRALLDRGEQVRVFARPTADPRPLQGLPVEIADGDVRDPAAVRRACEGVTDIVHAAASVHIGWSRLAEQRTVNVEGTRHVCQAARAVGARLVHVSSVDALGIGQRGAPADEDSPRQGKVPCSYVVTKCEAEAVVREAVAAGVAATIVNPGFMLGPWDWKPSSGRMLLAVATQFTLMAPTGGCSVCDVRDVAAAILAARDHGQRGRNYVLAGYNLTYLELWRAFARYSGGVSPICRLGPLMRIGAGRIGDLRARLTGRETEVNSAAVAMSSLFHYYSSARAAAELEYRNRPLDETIADCWQWFCDHGYVAPRRPVAARA